MDIKELKKFGFFKERLVDDLYPSINEMKLNFVYENLSGLTDYLNNGTPVVLAPGVLYCLLGCDNEIIASESIYTDGLYVWPGELSHYVEKHGICLPMNWLAFIKKNKYVPIIVEDEIINYIDENFERIPLVSDDI